MASALTWSVSMADRVSGVATSIGSKLGSLSAQFDKLHKASSKPPAMVTKAPPHVVEDQGRIDASARAMDRYRRAVDAAARSSGKLASRSVMGKTDANGSGLFGASSGRTAGPRLGGFARMQQWAGNNFGATGAAAVAKFGQALGQAGEMAGKMRGALGSAGAAMGALAGPAGMAAAAVAVLIGGVIALGAALVSVGIKAGEYIGRLHAMKQAHMFAFSSLLGSAPAAEAAWDDVRAASERYGMGLGETGAAFNDLLAKGFKLDEVKELVGYMADLKTLNPSANVEALMRAIGQIKGKGRLQQEELTGQLAEAGLPAEAVYKQLEKKLGKTRAEILKMITAGEIDSQTGIDAIKAAINEQAGGKSPGSLAAEAVSKSFLGQIMRARAMMDGFLSDLNIDFSPLTRLLDRIQGVFKSGAGDKLGAAIEGAFARVGKALDSWTPEDIQFGFDMLTTGAEAVGFAMETAINAVRMFTIGLREIRDAAREVNAEVDALKGKVGMDVNPVGFDGFRRGALGAGNAMAAPAGGGEPSFFDQILANFAGGNLAAGGLDAAASTAPAPKTFNINIVANGIDQPSLARMIAAEVQNAASQDADAP